MAFLPGPDNDQRTISWPGQPSGAEIMLAIITACLEAVKKKEKEWNVSIATKRKKRMQGLKESRRRGVIVAIKHKLEETITSCVISSHGIDGGLLAG